VKFLVDESTGQSVVNELRRLGHDVISIQEIFPSLDDPPILDIAGNENRILITNDKDFGELIYRSRLPHAGVLLFRLQDESAANRARMIRQVLQSCGEKLQGSFVIASERKIRIRRSWPGSAPS
jgi:predicted nuclease of predicted toxin-antitoxin system